VTEKRSPDVTVEVENERSDSPTAKKTDRITVQYVQFPVQYSTVLGPVASIRHNSLALGATATANFLRWERKHASMRFSYITILGTTHQANAGVSHSIVWHHRTPFLSPKSLRIRPKCAVASAEQRFNERNGRCYDCCRH
jgi:hypothetical protein